MIREEFRHGWRIAGVSLSILLLFTLGIHHQTVLYLVGLWNQLAHGEYGHGYVVLAISAYLILRNRRAKAGLMPCTNVRALLAVLVASLLWLLAALPLVLVLPRQSRQTPCRLTRFLRRPAPSGTYGR